MTDGRIIDLLKDRQTDSFYWPNKFIKIKYDDE